MRRTSLCTLHHEINLSEFLPTVEACCTSRSQSSGWMSGRVRRMCVEDKLEERNEYTMSTNEARLSYKCQFVRILTGQRGELKGRTANDLCCVDLNAMILIDGTMLRIFKTNVECQYVLQDFVGSHKQRVSY